MKLKDKKILITGGLGFIGFNCLLYFAKNNKVHVIDNESRLGVKKNLDYIISQTLSLAKISSIKKIGIGVPELINNKAPTTR